MFAISILSGLGAGARLDLTDGSALVVGRGEECALRLNDASASRTHCRISVSGGQVLLEDLGSTYGTQVNGFRVTSCTLRGGDRILVGNTELALEERSREAAKGRAPATGVPTVLAPLPLPEALPSAFEPTKAFTPEPLEVLSPPAKPARSRRPDRAKKAAPPASAKGGRRVADDANSPEGDDEGPAPFTAAKLNNLPGKKFVQYRVGSIVSRSHTGIVYKALDGANRRVALKIFWPDLLSDPRKQVQFVGTMRKMVGIEHPHLVQVVEVARTRRLCFTACEYVDGESVAGLMARAGELRHHDWKSAWRIAVGVARALELAEARRIVHRNIRPSNVLVEKKGGRAKLCDLMQAVALDAIGAERSVKRGEIAADVQYLSPEQAAGEPDLDGRADIYGLGVTLYALLTGHPPFEGSLTEVLSKIRTKVPEPIRKYHTAMPAEFEDVVLQMLAKRPADRFPTATAVLKHLMRVGKMQSIEDEA